MTDLPADVYLALIRLQMERWDRQPAEWKLSQQILEDPFYVPLEPNKRPGPASDRNL